MSNGDAAHNAAAFVISPHSHQAPPAMISGNIFNYIPMYPKIKTTSTLIWNDVNNGAWNDWILSLGRTAGGLDDLNEVDIGIDLSEPVKCLAYVWENEFHREAVRGLKEYILLESW